MRRLNGKKGQTTSEYLIMTVLVAVASIGLWVMYGQSIRLKLAYVVGSFGGDTQTVDHAVEGTRAAGYEAGVNIRQNETTIRGIDPSELQYSSP